MDNERYLLMQETNDLNTEITEKGFEISCLSTENKNLISQLKDIKSTMDDKIKIGKIFLEKKQRLANKEKQLNKKIEVLEKEIILAEKNNKIVEIIKNEVENQNKLLDIIFLKSCQEESFVGIYAQLCKYLNKELPQKIQINIKNIK